jgi:glutamine phosphoribosylpyrophosphate amidotransferase
MDRTQADVEQAKQIFSRLLVLSEHRGPYATGAAWVKDDGMYRLAKAPLSASSFVESDRYKRWHQYIDDSTAVLMGHTRYPTQGSHLNNYNNQPLLSAPEQPVLLTHNGHIPESQRILERMGLSHELEVDSEVLLQMARRNLGPAGLDLNSLLSDVWACPGQIAAVFVTPVNSDEIIFVRRERPLFLAYNNEKQLLTYASERQILTNTIHDGSWHIRCIPASIAVVVHRRHNLTTTQYLLD